MGGKSAEVFITQLRLRTSTFAYGIYHVEVQIARVLRHLRDVQGARVVCELRAARRAASHLEGMHQDIRSTISSVEALRQWLASPAN